VNTDKPITLERDCAAIMVPSGEKISLPAGSTVWLTQALGGAYTVMTERGHMARVDGHDGDALGLPQVSEIQPASGQKGDDVEARVWEQLRACFDPEIPVNIVELGLIYHCRVTPVVGGGHKVEVRFTLTAQGCGMGQSVKADIRSKLLAVPGVCEADVELVWDPPWNQSMISVTAKHQLGME
jgi:probable FeS assembly SUF system protein SufT